MKECKLATHKLSDTVTQCCHGRCDGTGMGGTVLLFSSNSNPLYECGATANTETSRSSNDILRKGSKLVCTV